MGKFTDAINEAVFRAYESRIGQIVGEVFQMVAVDRRVCLPNLKAKRIDLRELIGYTNCLSGSRRDKKLVALYNFEGYTLDDLDGQLRYLLPVLRASAHLVYPVAACLAKQLLSVAKWESRDTRHGVHIIEGNEKISFITSVTKPYVKEWGKI